MNPPIKTVGVVVEVGPSSRHSAYPLTLALYGPESYGDGHSEAARIDLSLQSHAHEPPEVGDRWTVTLEREAA